MVLLYNFKPAKGMAEVSVDISSIVIFLFIMILHLIGKSKEVIFMKKKITEFFKNIKLHIEFILFTELLQI